MKNGLGVLLIATVGLLQCQPSGTDVKAAPGPCPGAWLQAPAVDSTIAVPNGGQVVLHAAATGSQNYTCKQGPADAGASYAWSFVGPEATLKDCQGAVLGKHFASERGAAAPAWQTSDGATVVAHKVAASTPTPGAVPWLLLAADSATGGGPLTATRNILRVNTQGGLAPTAGCDASHAGETQKVPYSADYFFFAP